MSSQPDRFEARRSFRNAAVFLAVFALFSVGCLVSWFFTRQAEWAVVAGAWLLPVVLILVKSASPNSWYELADTGLTLRRGRSRRVLSPSEIAAVRLLPADDARRVIRGLMGPGVQAQSELDLKRWYRANIAYGEVTRYCSVTIVQSTTSAGSSRNVVAMDAKTTGGFVVVDLSDGSSLLISPEDAQGFVTAVYREWPGLAHASHGAGDVSVLRSTVQVDEHPGETPEQRRSRSRRRVRRLYLVTGSIAVILAAAVYLWQVSPAANATATQAADKDTPAAAGESSEFAAAGVDTWVAEDTFRFQVDCAVMGAPVPTDEAERNDRLLGELSTCWVESAAGTVVAYYVTELGLDPVSSEWAAYRSKVIPELTRTSAVLISSEYDEDSGFATGVIDASSEGLRGRLELIFLSSSE